MNWSVVIVAWNVSADLDICLDSLMAICKEIPLDIFIIDNASSDNTLELKNKYPNFHWLFNKNNLGFATANNQVRELIQTPYVLFLNPDTILTQNIFPLLSAFFEQHKQAGVIGPKILNTDGSEQRSVRRYPKVWQILFELLKGANIWPQLLHYYYGLDLDLEKTQPVDQVSGAALAIRKEILDKINWWDEKYFLWFDEVDLCFRTKKAGSEIWYLAEVSLTHKGGASFWQWQALRRQWHFARSASRYFSKNISKPQGLLIWILAPLWLIFGLLLSLILLLPLKRRYR